MGNNYTVQVPNEISDYCQLNQSFSVVNEVVQFSFLTRLIWVSTVCLRPTKRTLGLYGLISINGETLISNRFSSNVRVSLHQKRWQLGCYTTKRMLGLHGLIYINCETLVSNCFSSNVRVSLHQKRWQLSHKKDARFTWVNIYQLRNFGLIFLVVM